MKTTHVCPACKIEKPVGDFYHRFGKCKLCKSESAMARYHADPLKVKKRRAAKWTSHNVPILLARYSVDFM